MHLGARGFVHAELIDPKTGEPVELEDGATGELVLTHLRHRAAPLLRFRTRDHVELQASPCPCGRTAPRVRCLARTHHITIVGADRQTSIGFWEGVLGMPFVFEQPNLDNESESHLYFDPGDGRLITVFTNEEREPDPSRTATDIGCVHHIAFSVSAAT